MAAHKSKAPLVLILLSISMVLFGYFAFRGEGPATVQAETKAAQKPKAATKRPEVFQVGVLIWSENIPGQVAMRKGLVDEAERINSSAAQKGLPKVQLTTKIAGDGPEGISRQAGQMRELIALGVDLIVAQPTDNRALKGPLEEAQKKGIKVVAYDQYISGGKLDAYITSNNRQAGYFDGEYIAHRFPDDHEIKLILVEYPQVSSTVERLDGFLDALKDRQQKYKILRSYSAVEPVSGKKAGADILRDFPERGSIDVVFTVNDGGGLSVVDALAKAGRQEITIATIDGDPLSIQNITQGRLTVVDSAQFCGVLGQQAMSAGYRILLGEKVPEHQLVPTFPITKETMQRYPGWHGPLPKAFPLPWPSKEPQWLPKLVSAEAGVPSK